MKGQKSILKWLGLIGVFAVVVGGAVYFGVNMSTSGSVLGGGDAQEWFNYTDKYVDNEIYTFDNYQNFAVEVTAYAWETSDRPSSWGSQREIEDELSGAKKYDSVNGTTTLQLHPGEYSVYVNNSTYQSEFIEITVPEGDYVKLSEYTADTEDTPMLYMNNSPTIGAMDFGIASNLSNTAMSFSIDIEAPKYQCHIFEELVFKMNSTAGFDLTEDTDSDGTYDMGITELYSEFNNDRELLFKPTISIDKFEGTNNQYKIIYSNPVSICHEASMRFRVSGKANQNDTHIATDESFGDGEGLGTVTFVTISGATDTTSITG